MDQEAHSERGNAARRRGPGLPPDIQDKIGQQLRAIYDEVADKPIPDKFVQLLKELKDKEKG